MPDQQELAAVARAIIDANSYMTLGTADERGLPWASPVWYAPSGYGEFFWVSRPEARHSRNIAVRRDVSIVIFDSRAPIDTGQGVYMAALAELVAEADVARGMRVFSLRSQAQGGSEWGEADVRPPARLRLYRATAAEHWMLAPGDSSRIRVEPEGADE